MSSLSSQGATLTLQCVVRGGRPPPSLSWTVNGSAGCDDHNDNYNLNNDKNDENDNNDINKNNNKNNDNNNDTNNNDNNIKNIIKNYVSVTGSAPSRGAGPGAVTSSLNLGVVTREQQVIFNDKIMIFSIISILMIMMSSQKSNKSREKNS